MTLLSSGTKDIILSNLSNLRSLKTKTDSPIEDGIREEITMMVSNIFQPSEKKCLIDFSAAYLIDNSIKKIIVINLSE
jgi:hypothetical protein